MSWSPSHDALYLHLAIACIDGSINTDERCAIADVLPVLCTDRAQQAAMLNTVTDRLVGAGDALVVLYQSCCMRLSKHRTKPQRLDLLASLHQVAVADERRLNPAEVVLLRMAIVLLDLTGQVSVNPSGRLVRRFTPRQATA
ncbi:MAG: putative tellurite resistance protein B-like protein [Myxococcota bacterium]|jgi:uncharacterized tellurite resistance protein B-like protein